MFTNHACRPRICAISKRLDMQYQPASQCITTFSPLGHIVCNHSPTSSWMKSRLNECDPTFTPDRIVRNPPTSEKNQFRISDITVSSVSWTNSCGGGSSSFHATGIHTGIRMFHCACITPGPSASISRWRETPQCSRRPRQSPGSDVWPVRGLSCKSEEVERRRPCSPGRREPTRVCGGSGAGSRSR